MHTIQSSLFLIIYTNNHAYSRCTFSQRIGTHIIQSSLFVVIYTHTHTSINTPVHRIGIRMIQSTSFIFIYTHKYTNNRCTWSPRIGIRIIQPLLLIIIHTNTYTRKYIYLFTTNRDPYCAITIIYYDLNQWIPT